MGRCGGSDFCDFCPRRRGSGKRRRRLERGGDFPLLYVLFNKLFEAFFVDFFEKLAVAGFYNVAFYKYVCMVYVEAFENFCGVGDDEERAVCEFAVLFDSLCNEADSVYVEAGVGFIEDGEVWLEHKKLKNFALFAFSAGEAYVEVALCVFRLHVEELHTALQLFLEMEELYAFAGSLLNC